MNSPNQPPLSRRLGARFLAAAIVASSPVVFAGCAADASRPATTTTDGGDSASIAPAASNGASVPASTPSQPAAAQASTPHRALLWVNGMGCPQCSNNVDQQLRKVPGVEQVRINLGTGLVGVDLSPTDPPSEQVLAAAIERTGFTLVRLQMPAAGGGR